MIRFTLILYTLYIYYIGLTYPLSNALFTNWSPSTSMHVLPLWMVSMNLPRVLAALRGYQRRTSVPPAWVVASLCGAMACPDWTTREHYSILVVFTSCVNYPHAWITRGEMKYPRGNELPAGKWIVLSPVQSRTVQHQEETSFLISSPKGWTYQKR